MSTSTVNGIGAYQAANTYETKKKETDTIVESQKAQSTATSQNSSSGFSDTAAVYEPSSKIDRVALVKQLKADNQAQIDSMKKMAMEMIQGQGNTLAQSDQIWRFLADGKFTVTEAAKKQAKEAISEDGYWGVKQTSDRIVEFAKALSGGDVSKADMLFEAFKKGYAQATKAWGKELPDISSQTYRAVEEKFAAWKKEAGTDTVTA